MKPGDVLGAYRVVSELGAGGMGEVYRARDTALQRDVALKVLPESLAGDPDRLMRFEREAQALAALNHPNIAQIYGLEHSGDTPAIVMELVDGPTLAERIEAGPIPLDEALPIARQIAEGLGAAHERGILHRDLKPANIKVRDDGTVKLLDFGLAKALAAEPASADGSDLANSPTLTARATQMGIVLGTAAYMAPEQAKGKPVDKRADVWAFGVVLFEMLTGKRPFDGSDVTEVMARVLEREPDWTVLPASTPRAVERVLRRCLAKQRQDRLHDIADARLDLDASDADTAAGDRPAVGGVRRITLGVSVVAALVMGALASWLLGPDRPVTRYFDISLPADHQFPAGVGSLVTISPDGQHLVYVAVSGGATRLYHRPFTSPDSRVLEGTEGATHPFFSPDSLSVGFMGVDGALWTMPLTGGGPVRLTPSDQGLGYAVWRADGTIVFGRGREGIWSVPATGGEPRRLVEVDPDVAPDGYERLDLLPDEQVIVAEARRGSVAEYSIVLVSLLTGETVEVVAQGTDPTFVRTGHIVFARPGELWAVPVDADGMRTVGPPKRILGNVRVESGGAAHFSIGTDGTFVYVSGHAAESSLSWFDRAGSATPIYVHAGNLHSPRLSPDGRRIAFQASAAFGAGQEIWIYDLDSGDARRLTSDHEDIPLAWERTGLAVLFSSPTRSATPSVYRMPADFRAEDPEVVGVSSASGASGTTIRGGDLSPDGTRVVFQLTGPGNDSSLEVASVGAGPPAGEFLSPLAGATLSPAISPDGKWIAYVSNSTGSRQDEVLVTSFPEPGPTTKVSTDGGTQPRWSADGRELFYIAGTDLYTVPVGLDAVFRRLGPPRRLFDLGPEGTRFERWSQDYDYDAATDRFIVAHDTLTRSIRFDVILDYFRELERLVPDR